MRNRSFIHQVSFSFRIPQRSHAFPAILFFLLLAACKKDGQGTFRTATPTIYQYVNSDPQLSLYKATLTRAGMNNADAFSNGPLTLFAPVDSAFIRAGLTKDSINRFDSATLSLVLKYDMVFGRISSNSLIGFYSEDAQSLDTAYKPRLEKNYYGIFFDGIPLVPGGTADLNDGVVHKLQRMPFPPTGNLLDLILHRRDLSFFLAALRLIGYDTVIANHPRPGVSESGSIFTLFAPNNNAFIKIGFPDADSVSRSDPGFMQSLISRYLLDGGKLFTSSFIGGYSLLYDHAYVEADGFTIITKGNALPTHIVDPDILATNGVLQIVDQVYAY